jgi:hypothetical protein
MSINQSNQKGQVGLDTVAHGDCVQLLRQVPTKARRLHPNRFALSGGIAPAMSCECKI